MNDSPPQAMLSQWLRLSPWAMAILFIREIVRFARENVPVLLGAGASVALIERIGLREVVLAGVSLMLIGGVLSLLYYKRFRFRLEDDVLFVQKGLFERTEIRLEAGRVQHMSIEQPAFMRPFGVVQFSVSTPGGVGADVELPGIRRELAERLQQFLGIAGEETGAASRADSAQAHQAGRQVPLFKIRALDLTLHGVSSNYTYMLAVALSPLLQPLDRLMRHSLREQEATQWAARLALEAPGVAILVMVVVLVLCLLLISVAFSWLRFFDYALERDQARFIQRSGLLNRQEQALSIAKLQSVEWVQTAIGRVLGRGYLVCRQYGGGVPAADHAGRHFLVPGLNREKAMALSRLLWAGLTPASVLRRVSPYYRRVLFLRLWLLASAVTLGGVALTANPRGWLFLALATLLLWPAAHQCWRITGWRFLGRYVLVRRGFLGQRTAMFPVDKVQAVTVRQSWFQRRHGLATLRLHLASGPQSIPFITQSEALQLANQVLYQVESAAVITGDKVAR